MPKGEVPNLSEQDAEECMHCAIIDMVNDRIAAGGANAANLAGEPRRRHPPGIGEGAGEAYGAHPGGFGRLLSSEERRRQ